MKTKKRILLVLLGLFASNMMLLAQVKKTVSGTVKDPNGVALFGATVTEKGTKNSTQADANGTFFIKVNSSATLVISYVGFDTKEVSASDDAINVSLTSNNNNKLEEVVVTALGVSKKEKKLGYAATTVKGEELTRTNTINPITALQGKVAGVSISTTGSSGVQSSPYISIRGAKVLGANNQPIFIVDGNFIENNIQSADGADLGSQLKNLNPDDYETITVLKGAAATALYGSRGINGAVVITTKRAKLGKGLGIEYNTTYQTQNVYRSAMDFQDEYGMGGFNREGAWLPDGTTSYNTRSFGPRYDASLLAPSVTDASIRTPYAANPNNWKTFYRTGKFVNNNIAISGGNEKLNIRFSYSNTRNSGMLPNNELNRNAFDFKLRGQVNDVFSVDFGLSYANSVTKNWFSSGRYDWGSGQNLAFLSYYLPRNLDIADWYSKYRKADNTPDYNNPFAAFTGNGQAIINAFSKFDKNNSFRYENSLLSYFQLKAQILPWLDASAKVNVNHRKNRNEEKNYGNNTNNQGGLFASYGSNATDYNILAQLHGRHKIANDWDLDARIFHETYGNTFGEEFGAQTIGGLAVPNQFFLGNSVENLRNVDWNPSYSFNRPNRLVYGAGAIANISYKDIFNVELTFRNDWLSVLTYPDNVVRDGATNNFSVSYPSINTSYSFYDHFIDKMPKWLSSGRLRASLAYVGNGGATGAYQTNIGFSPGTYFNQNSQPVPFATQFRSSEKPNYNLKPQTQRSIEIGTAFGLFDNRVNVDFAWYKTNTFNQTISLGGVIETGYSRYFLNAGNIQNKGWELLVNFSPVKKRDWGLDLSVNMGANKSKIIEFGNGIKEWELSQYDGAGVFAYEGGDFGVLTAEQWASAKIDPKTGFPVITVGPVRTGTGYNNQDYSYVGASERQKIGKIEPNLTGGFSASLRYKNFSLFAQLDGRFGGLVYSEALNYAGGRGTPEFTLQYRDKQYGGSSRINSFTGKEVFDGAVPNVVFEQGQKSPKDPTKDIGGMTFKEAYDKGLVDAWRAPWYYLNTYGWGTAINFNKSVSELSYVMLREITLGYAVPKSITDKIHLKGARISLTARNIGYLHNTLSGGQNPESLQGNNPFTPYISAGVPFVRNFAASLNITL